MSFRRFAMKTKSDILEAVHETASGLHREGYIPFIRVLSIIMHGVPGIQAVSRRA